MPTAKYKNPQPPVKPPRHRRCVYRDSVFVYVFVKQRKRATEKERERERVRFQVNYSIIAVDILLFVAVVDRRPAAESGSLSTLFAPRILAISRARFSSPARLPSLSRSRPLFPRLRIRVSPSASFASKLMARSDRLIRSPRYVADEYKKLR